MEGLETDRSAEPRSTSTDKEAMKLLGAGEGVIAEEGGAIMSEAE